MFGKEDSDLCDSGKRNDLFVVRIEKEKLQSKDELIEAGLLKMFVSHERIFDVLSPHYDKTATIGKPPLLVIVFAEHL